MRCFRKETGLEKKEERVSVLTVVLFILGPLPQFIKLNACSGIPWTLAWSWMHMLCYVVTAITIVCGRGSGQGYALLRAGTTLHDDSKEQLKSASDYIYVAAHIAQAAFTFWLISATLYTNAIQVVIGRVISLIFATFALAFIPMLYIFFAVMLATSVCGGCCGCKSTVYSLGVGSSLVLCACYLAWWIYLLFTEPETRSLVLGLGPNPFTVWSFLCWLVFLGIVAFIALGICMCLSGLMGPNLEISINRSPDGEPASEVSLPLVENEEQASNSKEVSDQLAKAAFQMLLAMFLLLSALSYHSQKYDPSNTAKPEWVDVFG